MESPARASRRRREELGIQPVAQEKRCAACGIRKDRDEFPASSQVSDGLSSWCRECHAEANRLWRVRVKAKAEAVR